MTKNSEDEMVQTTIRLPKSMLDRLQKTGARSGGSEMRARLEQSFEREADPATDLFTARATSLAREITKHFGSWATDRFAFEAYSAALPLLLGAGPEGEAVPHLKDASLQGSAIFSGRTTPEEAGRFMAFMVMNARR